jgi:hypothetical protein
VANFRLGSVEGIVTSNIQGAERERMSDTSDGVTLPFSLHRNPGVTCSQKLSSSYAGSQENDDEVIIEDEIINQKLSVDGVTRGKSSVFESEKSSVDDIMVISHTNIPPRISPSAAARIKREVRRAYLERHKKRCVESSEYSYKRDKMKHSVRVPNLSAFNDTTSKAVECLPIQNKSQHRHNNTDISGNVDKSAALCKSSTFSSKHGNIVSRTEVSKPENKPVVSLNTVRTLADRWLTVEGTSISVKSANEDILPISEKNNRGNSTIMCKNEMSPAAASYRQTESTLPLVDCEILECKITHHKSKNADACTATCENLIPVTTNSGIVSGLSSAAPKVSVESESSKNVVFSRMPSDVRNQPEFSSGCKISLSRSKTSQSKIENKVVTHPRTDSNMVKQCALSSEHLQVSLSKVNTKKTDVREDKRVIKASGNSCSQNVVCPLSHLKTDNDVHSVQVENVSSIQPCISDPKHSAVLQSKSLLEVSTSMHESNKSSIDCNVVEQRPAANLNQEKSSSPHVTDVTNIKCLMSRVKKPSPVTVTIERESDTLISTVRSTLPSHQEAKIVRGPAERCEPLNSINSSVHMRGESVKCNLLKSSEVFLTSSSEKQVSVLPGNMHNYSLERGKETCNEEPPSSTKKVESVNKLHNYISLLFLDTERQENKTWRLSSDEGQKTKFTSIKEDMLVQNQNVVAEIRQSSSHTISTPCKANTSTTHEQIVHISLCSDVESKSKEACRSPEVKEKKTSDCTARNNNIFDVQNSTTPGSPSGSSVTCTRNSATIHTQSPTGLCNTPGKDFMQPAATISEAQVTHSQSQSFKLSYEISQHPRRFCRNAFDVLMTAQKNSRKKTPSKRLSRFSPIKCVVTNQSPRSWRYRTVSPNKAKASKALNFESGGTEKKSGSLPSRNSENQSSMSEVSYSDEYVANFEAIIAEVFKDRDLLSLLSEEEVTIVTSFWKLENQVKKLYVRMLGRKYTWHRVSDIKYDEIHVPAAFAELEVSGFVTSGLYKVCN